MKNRLIFNMVAIACLLLLGLVFLLLINGAQPPEAANSSSQVTTLSEAAGATTPSDTSGTTATLGSTPTTATTTPSQPTEPKATESKPTEPKPTEPKPTTPPATEAPTEPVVTTPPATEAPTEPEATTQPPQDLPPSVVIPPEDKETGLSFPCLVPGYDLVIEKLAPYSGLYVEDGSNSQCTDVAMILVRNNGDEAVEYAKILISYESQELQFQLSALPAGESAVVQELTAATVPQEKAMEASILVVQRSEMHFAPEISVKDNGDNSLTVENLTDQEIPTVRVFYKYYMADEALYVGGIAFTLKLSRLPAKGSLVVRPSHFVSQTSQVVMTQIYGEDGG